MQNFYFISICFFLNEEIKNKEIISQMENPKIHMVIYIYILLLNWSKIIWLINLLLGSFFL